MFHVFFKEGIMNTIYRCVSLCLLFLCGAAISVANAQDVFLEGGSIQIARALKMGRESSSSIYSSSSTLSTKSAKKKSDLQKVVCPAHSVCNSKGRITGCETGYGLAPDYQAVPFAWHATKDAFHAAADIRHYVTAVWTAT